MVEEALLQRLSKVFDADSRPVFVSVFADLSDPGYRTQLDRRAREIEAAVSTETRPLFRQAWDDAKKALDEEAGKDGTRGVAVFSSPEHGLLEALGLRMPVSTKLVLDSSPYVRPLARFLDEHESFVLLLLDGQDAAVYVVEAGTAELETSSETQPMSRHKKGGMSQARYQRHRDGVMNQFFDEVAKDVLRVSQEAGTDRIIVAGPGQPKRLFVERAPKELKERIIAEEDADFKQGAEDPVLAQRFVALARTLAQKAAHEDLERLRSELRVGERAVTGAFDVIAAAVAGRVATLIVLHEHKVPASKCEEHQAVVRPGATCMCGNAGNTVDAINEAIEFALRQGGRVEFVKADPFLESLGGVGAILRF